MAGSNKDIKKAPRKADENLPERNCERGKRPDQKMKPYLVLQYLMRFTDANNTANAFDILAFLVDCKIIAGCRSFWGKSRLLFFML